MNFRQSSIVTVRLLLWLFKNRPIREMKAWKYTRLTRTTPKNRNLLYTCAFLCFPHHLFAADSWTLLLLGGYMGESWRQRFYSPSSYCTDVSYNGRKWRRVFWLYMLGWVPVQTYGLFSEFLHMWILNPKSWMGWLVNNWKRKWRVVTFVCIGVTSY